MRIDYFSSHKIWISAIITLSMSPLAHAYTVVLNPGHGGTETGVRTEITAEKDVTLAFAKVLERPLATRQDVTVLLTRKEDYPVSSDERRRIANTSSASVYISLEYAPPPKSKTCLTRIYALPRMFLSDPPAVLPLERAHDLAQDESARLARELFRSLSEGPCPATVSIAALPLTPLLGITIPAALIEVSETSQFEALAASVTDAIDRFRLGVNNPAHEIPR